MPGILQADLTLIDGRLKPGVAVHVGRSGRITKVSEDELATGVMATAVPRPPIDESQPGEFGSPRSRRKVRLRGRILIPGFVNAHSHAFQRLMRGRTEYTVLGQPGTDFWSWRSGMYRVTEQLSPEDLETVSALAYMEMLRAGFTHVCEFHYLHQQPGGGRYADPAELSARMIQAAEFAGIGMTLLRVAYQRGGPNEPASREQRRFIDSDPEAFAKALEATAAHIDTDDRRPQSLGVAAHSVRALDTDWLRELARLAERKQLPLHAHVAEQPREIDQCLVETGKRPMEHLADCGLLSDRFTAVHATHLGTGEAELLGSAGGTACICPTTERNLGDGLPDLGALRAAGAKLAIGTDSHVRIDPFAEIRALEDGERLRTGKRGRLTDHEGLIAPTLFDAGTLGGAATTTHEIGEIREGAMGDLVALEADDPALAGVAASRGSEDALLAAIAVAGHSRLVKDVWVGGRHVVTDGVLLRWQGALEAYNKVAKRIWS
ncbi:MAG: formimidoylglutamate deiminase [Proteobacteria bacterium]|nr:formimidoylglutamate deiminase [Pseudomonadota bacterium]